MPAAEERLSVVQAKMEQVGTTLARMEAILMSLDEKVDRLDLRVDKLDARVEKQFLWVAGIQMTTLITIMAGLFGLVAKLL
jgi:predicted nuclease with TOPRIM domain